MRFHDVHVHLFNIQHIPIKTFMRRYGIGLSVLMRKIPFTNLDERARCFAGIAEKNTFDVVMHLSRETDILCSRLRDSGIFDASGKTVCPLVINFSGDSQNKKLNNQEDDLQDVINFYNSHHIENKMCFVKFSDESSMTSFDHGFKIYPPMGVDVEHQGYMPKFAVANNKRIPITVHCSDGGFFSTRFSRAHLISLSNPKKWKSILSTFPNLKVNFAHVGGLKHGWVRTIRKLMDKYPNVYSDVSSVLSNPRKCKRCVDKLPADRILFGSDWYMSKLDCTSYPDMCYNFLKQFPRDNIEDMLSRNPERFLNEKVPS
jgi:hypothetical protein